MLIGGRKETQEKVNPLSESNKGDSTSRTSRTSQDHSGGEEPRNDSSRIHVNSFMYICSHVQAERPNDDDIDVTMSGTHDSTKDDFHGCDSDSPHKCRQDLDSMIVWRTTARVSQTIARHLKWELFYSY